MNCRYAQNFKQRGKRQVILTYNTEDFTNLLENFLIMNEGSKFIYQTYEVPYKKSPVKERFEIEFTGDIKVVREKMLKWLERRVNE